MGFYDSFLNFNSFCGMGCFGGFSQLWNSFSFGNFMNYGFNMPAFNYYNPCTPQYSLFDFNRYTPSYRTNTYSYTPQSYSFNNNYPSWNNMGLNLSTSRGSGGGSIEGYYASIVAKKQPAAKPKYSPVVKSGPSELFTNSKLKVQKVKDGKPLSYVLIAPEDVRPDEKLPVLVYLHGSGQVGKSLDDLIKYPYDPALYMPKWNLKNFRGYIICPQLKAGTAWHNEHSAKNIRTLLDNFATTHNIDRSRIAVAGASLGGQGALYMANSLSDVFRKAVSLSPYAPGNIRNGKMKIPTKAFAGGGPREDSSCQRYINNTLKTVLGTGNATILPGESHTTLPAAALKLDKNNNNCSDVLEWLFS